MWEGLRRFLLQYYRVFDAEQRWRRGGRGAPKTKKKCVKCKYGFIT